MTIESIKFESRCTRHFVSIFVWTSHSKTRCTNTRRAAAAARVGFDPDDVSASHVVFRGWRHRGIVSLAVAVVDLANRRRRDRCRRSQMSGCFKGCDSIRSPRRHRHLNEVPERPCSARARGDHTRTIGRRVAVRMLYILSFDSLLHRCIVAGCRL
jgi:hypothetical protein